jgi:hypothetical protein
MLRLLVGDECYAIRVQVTIGHPETVYCHSESFDRLRINSAKRGTVILSPALGGTKDLEILRRYAPQNDIETPGYILNKAKQL